MARQSRQAMLDELADIGAQLARQDDLYKRRADLFVKLRQLDPPVLQRELADAADLSEGAVSQVMRELRRQGRL